MNGAFYVGAVGLNAHERALAIVSHNLSNINTTAFKRSAVRFTELVDAPSMTARADAVDPDTQVKLRSPSVSGVAATSVAPVFEQGDLKPTGGALDIALSGDGFIELAGPGNETLLWRGGTLKVDRDGYLATVEGIPLKAMISVPDDATALQIGRDGSVIANFGDEQSPREIGRIDLAMVRDPSALLRDEGGYYRVALDADLRVAAPGEDGAALLIQGSLESSNVELSNEMVSLLLMQRAYAASAQIVQAGDQLMAIANSLRR
ncbi:flagellar hook-basal body protein [Sphingomonas sanxanigenens]|uniref:Uncharacterized protein n=1 Tax=Sphingomonas sanxanigenens DSM 19645 = NX02 TaxID=1123269 RepID=W0AH85_9SPHN|nr:flagellar hook-basal body protein [Sphingomonas sanxanigenens]AHE55658.1 hypothetical protein NX02_19995 [Sphingomonas sanxanigenens DSM 19645 = NX02]